MPIDYKETVTGTIIEKSGPIKGATVSVYDKDLLIDDHLGTTTTDGNGRFEVDFKWSDYKDGPYEDRPDIYLKIQTADGRVIKTEVFEEMKSTLAEDDSEVFDLGEITVE